MVLDIASREIHPHNDINTGSSREKSAYQSAASTIVLARISCDTLSSPLHNRIDEDELSPLDLLPPLRDRVYLKRQGAEPLMPAYKYLINTSPDLMPVYNADTRVTSGRGSGKAGGDFPVYVREKRRELRPLLGALRFVESSNRYVSFPTSKVRRHCIADSMPVVAGMWENENCDRILIEIDSFGNITPDTTVSNICARVLENHR